MSPSFAYIYDSVYGQGMVSKESARIEAELGRLGIQGPIFREGFHEVQQQLDAAIKDGVKNVVFVGGDAWFLQRLPWIAQQRGVSIGYLPSVPTALSRAIGMPPGAASVGILAARVIKTLDLGAANDRPFLTEAVALETSARLTLEGSYAVSARTPSPLAIQNFALQPKTGEVLSQSMDGQLEAVLQTTIARPGWLGVWKKTEIEETRIAFTRGAVQHPSGEPVHFTVDGQPLTSKEVRFSVLPGALPLIVGPDRLFS